MAAGGQAQTTGGAGRRATVTGTAVGGTAPHTRPGDQNTLCIETDQA